MCTFADHLFRQFGAKRVCGACGGQSERDAAMHGGPAACVSKQRAARNINIFECHTTHTTIVNRMKCKELTKEKEKQNGKRAITLTK